jgi:hypothetical protein
MLAPKTINENDPGKRVKFLSDPAVLSMFLEAILHEEYVSAPICHALAAVCIDINLKFREMPKLTDDDFNQASDGPDQPDIELNSEGQSQQLGGGAPPTPTYRAEQADHGFDDSFLADAERKLTRFSDDRDIEMLSRRVFISEETATSYLPLLIGAAAIVLFVAMQSK